MLRGPLARFRLPITLGYGSPAATIYRDGSKWRMQAITTNVTATTRVMEHQHAEGQPFVPEMTVLENSVILAEAASASELADLIEKMELPPGFMFPDD